MFSDINHDFPRQRAPSSALSAPIVALSVDSESKAGQEAVGDEKKRISSEK